MADEAKNVLNLTRHEGMTNPFLSLWSEDADLVERFRQIVYLTLPRDLQWFHQCNSEHYHQFEFWKDRRPEWEAHGARIATELGIPFIIALD